MLERYGVLTQRQRRFYLHMNSASNLPDVASTLAAAIPLDQVGMSGIALPVTLILADAEVTCAASAAIYANVSNGQKGLHMSRMYSTLLSLSDAPLSASSLQQCAQQALAQQQEVNASSLHFSLSTKVQQKRSALNSQGWGWNAYPLELQVSYSNETGFELKATVQVTYSSSCPASAALSRKALKDAFLAHSQSQSEPMSSEQVALWLEQQGTLAIPHSQRSVATVTVAIEQDELPISELIELCEAALGTPVQTYVKRDDEQQFALRNGANPMFVEDASRRLVRALVQQGYQGHLKVEHQESLHGHDAVAATSFSAYKLAAEEAS